MLDGSETHVKPHLQLNSAGGNSPLIITHSFRSSLKSSPLLPLLQLCLMLPLGSLVLAGGSRMLMIKAFIPFLTALPLLKGTVSSPCSQHHLVPLTAPHTPLFPLPTQVFPIAAPSAASNGTHHADPAQITALPWSLQELLCLWLYPVSNPLISN